MDAPGANPPFPLIDTDWFPVRITSIPAAGQYVFQECWLDGSLVVADRVGGRSNTTNDRAYPIDGGTFTVSAVGATVQAFARRAAGAGGTAWELKGFSGGTPIIDPRITLDVAIAAGWKPARDYPSGAVNTIVVDGSVLVTASGFVIGLASAEDLAIGLAAFEKGTGTLVSTTVRNPIICTAPNPYRIPFTYVCPASDALLYDWGMIYFRASGFGVTTAATVLIVAAFTMPIQVR